MPTKSDDSASERSSIFYDSSSNIPKTLDHILKEQKLAENELLLICGSFFIMSDVKQYFGYE
jgi:folylpolyglutamate synthase/dihydropteroate synthase